MANEHEGHRKRLKTRFKGEGLDGFEPHNVLELLLFFAIPRGDTNPVAHRLMTKFGRIDRVFDAPFEELCKVDGVGENSAVLIKMIPQLARYYVTEKSVIGTQVNSARDVGEYVLPRFLGLTEEKLMLVSIDNKGRIIGCTTIAEGEVDSINVSMRKVVETAIYTRANNAVLAHNHPQGFAAPSEEDVNMTSDVKSVLKTLGIKLLDHIIVSHDDFVSLNDSGLII